MKTFIIFVLLFIPSILFAESFDSIVKPTPKIVTKIFAPARYKGYEFWGVTSKEYKYNTDDWADKKIRERANQICKYFGFEGSNNYTIKEDSHEYFEAYMPDDKGIMLQKHELGWSSWTAATIILGVPVAYNNRIFNSISCYKSI